MKSKLLGLTAVIAFLGLSPANASTYQVSFDVGIMPVTGMIETNCDSCTLNKDSDFVSWSFSFDSVTITQLTSTLTLSSPYPLSAGSGAITFNPSELGVTEFIDSSLDELVFDDGAVSLDVGGIGKAIAYPTSSFVVATIASTPLPPALPLFGAGLSVIGLLGWRRKRKAQASA